MRYAHSWELPQAATKSCVVVMHSMLYHHIFPGVGHRYHYKSSGAAVEPGLVSLNRTALPLDWNSLKSCLHFCMSQSTLALLVCPSGSCLALSFQGEHGGSCGVKNHQHPLHGAVASVCSGTVGVCYGPISGYGVRELVLRIHTLHVSGLFLLWTRCSLVPWTVCPLDYNTWVALLKGTVSFIWKGPQPSALRCMVPASYRHGGRAGAFFCSLWEESESRF